MYFLLRSIYFGSLELVPQYCNNFYLNYVLFEVRNVFTSLLGLVIVSHLSPKGSGRFNHGAGGIGFEQVVGGLNECATEGLGAQRR